MHALLRQQSLRAQPQHHDQRRADEKLAQRVELIHRQLGTAAIAEQYIEGREIYVAVIGNERLQAYTPWELLINRLPEGAPQDGWDLEELGLVVPKDERRGAGRGGVATA